MMTSDSQFKEMSPGLEPSTAWPPTTSSTSSLLELLSAAAAEQQRDQHQCLGLEVEEGTCTLAQPHLQSKDSDSRSAQQSELVSLMDIISVNCKICGMNFNSKETFMSHVRLHHQIPVIAQEKPANSEEKRLFLCGECYQTFPTSRDCKIHVLKTHKIKLHKFETNQNPSRGNDNDETATINAIVSNSNGPEDNFRCPRKFCACQFSCEESLRVHLNCHSMGLFQKRSKKVDKSFSCFRCHNKHFQSWKECSGHLWSQHQIDVDLFKCNLCTDFRTPVKAKLDQHLLTHQLGEGKYKCATCGKTFKQMNQLRNHSVTHMSKDSDKIPLWYSKKQCEICSKFFSDSKCLKKHVQAVHSKLKPYICQICNHQSARKAMLEMHMRQHTGEKPYQCSRCEFRTGDHNTLRRHKLTHEGARPYKCPYCEYAAIQSNNFKNHLRSKHPEEEARLVFSCQYCHFKTINKEKFFGHVIHHELQKSAPDDVSEETFGTEGYSKGEEDIGEVLNKPITTKECPKNKSKQIEIPEAEDDDSLHATMDFGGTTIPATTND